MASQRMCAVATSIREANVTTELSRTGSLVMVLSRLFVSDLREHNVCCRRVFGVAERDRIGLTE